MLDPNGPRRPVRVGLRYDRLGLSCDSSGLSCDRFGLRPSSTAIHSASSGHPLTGTTLTCLGMGPGIKFGLSCDRSGLSCDRFGMGPGIKFGDKVWVLGLVSGVQFGLVPSARTQIVLHTRQPLLSLASIISEHLRALVKSPKGTF
jgi:hypothetical protein